MIHCGDSVRNFFPATTAAFEPQCGSIEHLHESDFTDEHRRRHLLSFQESWNQWASFDARKKNIQVDAKVLDFTKCLLEMNPGSVEDLNIKYRELRRKFKIAPSKSHLLAAYEQCIDASQYARNPVVEQFLIKKIVRTHSGVLVITVLTSPGSFSCPQDCHYCPNEPGQPRSYLSTEPAVLRANQNGWDAAAQFWDRGITLYKNGHTVDKIEVLVLGGTWSGYPKDYQKEFIRDLFYAANTFELALKHTSQPLRDVISAATTRRRTGEGLRDRLTLSEEQIINRTASCRIIGVTLETRPDHIYPAELKRLRQFGCTRVQIGIQHVNDNILSKVNRGCYLRHAIQAIRLLKDACFKVDIHLMPDLPGSTVFTDQKMFEDILTSVALQADQWKIYPCEITPFSQIEQWYKQKRFLPYAEAFQGYYLLQLLLKVKAAVHPWIRLNRIVRDIPNPSIIAGNSKTNLRQSLQDEMKKKKLFCRCLRCREVRTKNFDSSQIVLKIRHYPSFGGLDFFLSFETKDETILFAFLRLRIRKNITLSIQDDPLLSQVLDDEVLDADNYNLNTTFPELEGCGLIRELHVYGLLVGSTEKKNLDDGRTQHSGLGRKLLAAAEMITLSHGLTKLAVIAGVGTTEYYQKFGYQIENHFMTKKINKSSTESWAKHVELQLPLQLEIYSLKTILGDIDIHPEDQELNKTRENSNSFSTNESQDSGPRPPVQTSHCIAIQPFEPLFNGSYFSQFLQYLHLLSYPRKTSIISCLSIFTVSSLVVFLLRRSRKK